MKPKVYEAKSKMKILFINSQNAAGKVIADVSSNLDDNVVSALPSYQPCLVILEAGDKDRAKHRLLQQEEVAVKYPTIIKFLKMVINFYFTIAGKMMKGEY